MAFVVKALGEHMIRRLVYTAALLLIGVVAIFLVSMQVMIPLYIYASECVHTPLPLTPSSSPLNTQ